MGWAPPGLPVNRYDRPLSSMSGPFESTPMWTASEAHLQAPEGCECTLPGRFLLTILLMSMSSA